MTHRISFECRACKSRNVKQDAYAAWDEQAQDWSLANVFDADMVCDDCGEENVARIQIAPDGANLGETTE
ncbi:hypothetical protein GCM10007036_14140 [Alsobacter metallidurans]|uniref:Uncharacterized protein n=1 Tax=Alsobacter metallidurans TaxID=340221 RepID=A0A917MHG0_9HYPH|nr:hypothetical protein [Alsobacter metallidurans]GGH14657.1 hypothetical protein GCM10007036_14140 [Alsobacter metallidurans]